MAALTYESRRKPGRARIAGGVVCALGLLLAFVVVPAETFPIADAPLPPSGLPTVASLGIALCGFVAAIFPTPDDGWPLLRPLFKILCILCITYLGVRYAGYFALAPLLMLGLMLMMGERRVGWYVAGVLVVPAVIWVIFALLLAQTLP